MKFRLCHQYGKHQKVLLHQLENLKLLEEELEGKQFSGGIVDIAFGWLANLLLRMHEFSKLPVIADCWPPHEKLVSKFLLVESELVTRWFESSLFSEKLLGACVDWLAS
uniref:Uncharacterized protein n=1 Tax=Salix viminalis TaxID=40686 RepID=A0A6N2LFW9_SALVM